MRLDGKHVTLDQFVLAWLLAQQLWIGSILGTTKLVPMHENVLAGGFDLMPDEGAEINMAVARINVQGERLPQAAGHDRIGRGTGGTLPRGIDRLGVIKGSSAPFRLTH